jgi:outer membrane protein assembly factor BamD
MMLRATVMAVLVFVLAGWSPVQDPTFQIAQNAEDSGKAANVIDPAENEVMVGRSNMDKHDYVGAVGRFMRVIKEYPTSPYAEEALARLTDVYLALGIMGEAQCAVAVLQRKFPDSTWSHQAIDALKSAGLEPAENQASRISRAFR